MEALSFIASCLVLVGYLVKNQKVFRIIGTVSGFMFTVYGIAMGLPSIIFMNVSCLTINVFNLVKILRAENKEKKLDNVFNFIIRNSKVA